MEDLFTPSLIVSLGPSAGKALELSKKLMGRLPGDLIKVICFYNIEDIVNLGKDLQSIIDEGLLSARNLNKLVDMGFKVRNENVNQVRINVYLLWDLYDSWIPGNEVIKILAGLNYGNVNKDLHSGASLFILPILKKEWEFELNIRVRAIEELRESINYITQQDRLLAIDSRVYLLHCVSSDGARVAVDELEQIASLLIYNNVIPSGDPPLSHYNKKLLLAEGKYKTGTVGMTSLIVFEDELRQSFSEYLAVDILSCLTGHESYIDLSNFRAPGLLDYKSLRENLAKIIYLEQKGISQRLDEELSVGSVRDISGYREAFKDCSQYIEQNSQVLRDKIDAAIAEQNEEIRKTISFEVEAIMKNHNLKTAVGFLNRIEEDIKNIKERSCRVPHDNLAEIDKGLEVFLGRFPGFKWIAGGTLALTSVLVILIALFLFPISTIVFDISSFIIFLMAMASIPYVILQYKRKRVVNYLNRYRDCLLEKNAALLNNYIDRSIDEKNKLILADIVQKKDDMKACIKKAEELFDKITSEMPYDENTGGLVVSVLNRDDRKRFYEENKPCISSIYKDFTEKLKYCSQYNEDKLYEVVLDYTKQFSVKFAIVNLGECLRFKYGQGVRDELSKWVDRGRIKSNYLLQYTINEGLEEHTIFMADPEICSMAREIISDKLDYISISEGEDTYTNSITIIRLCFGMDFECIPSVKNAGL